MGCPAEQTIAQFVEGELDPAASDNIEAHIDGCSECRQAVAAAARGGIRSVLSASLQSGNSELPTMNVTKSQKLIPGAAVGRYVVRRIVGAGGMGIVYAAYDPSLEREVALKILHPELGAFAGERLDREAKIMARLGASERYHHPRCRHHRRSSLRRHGAGDWRDARAKAAQHQAARLAPSANAVSTRWSRPRRRAPRRRHSPRFQTRQRSSRQRWASASDGLWIGARGQ